MRILITGASGYIGSRLCLFLSKIGHSVSAICKTNSLITPTWEKNLDSVIIGDLTKKNTLNKVEKLKPQIIIHTISLDSVMSEKNINCSFDINTKLTWKLLDSFSGTLKKFIYFSTVHVLGEKNNIKMDNLSPDNIYGLTHLLSEKICNYYNRKGKINCINIRLTNSYGEPIFFNSKCWHLVINNFVKSAFLKKKIILKSEGNSKRSFIHYSDICDRINKIIENNLFLKNDYYYFDTKYSYTVFEIAVKVQSVYFDLYNYNIPIYINDKIVEKDSRVDLNLIRGAYKNEIDNTSKKSIYEGIFDLFKYLEKIYS